MQNVGLAFSLIPLIRKMGVNRQRRANMLTRHISLFNSHPYLTGPIIGSVARIEEESCEVDDCPEAVRLKKTLMAPYAALGVPFFWGALRPSFAIAGIIAALEGFLLAPLFFMFLYNCVHVWVRLKGFIEGYRDGKGAIEFLRAIDMPQKTRMIKWVSLVSLALLAVIILGIPSFSILGISRILAVPLVLISILFCRFIIKKGVSPLVVLYGTFFVFIIIAI
jgi:PTS system mannose-specific IID component